MAVGIGLGPALGGRSAGEWSPGAFGSDLYAWWRADLGITLNGGDVSAWADQSGNGRNFSQATAANQALYVPSDSRFGGKPSIEFNGTSDFYQTGVAATWKMLHDGTGVTLLAVFHCPATTGARVLLDTCNATAVNVGFSTFFNHTTDVIATQVSAGGGTNAIVTPGISTPDGVSHVYGFGYAEGASPTEWEARMDRAASGSGNSTAAPSAANPFGTLTLGRTSTTGNFFLLGAVAEIAILRRRLTTLEFQQFETYSLQRYGV
jgi:hypothetical protein